MCFINCNIINNLFRRWLEMLPYSGINLLFYVREIFRSLHTDQPFIVPFRRTSILQMVSRESHGNISITHGLHVIDVMITIEIAASYILYHSRRKFICIFSFFNCKIYFDVILSLMDSCLIGHHIKSIHIAN